MRKVTSVVLAVCFVLILVTVIPMATRDKHHGGRKIGRFAAAQRGMGPHGGEMPPHGEHGDIFPRVIHEWAGYTFLVFGAIHVYLNRKCLFSYMGIKQRRE